LFFVFSINISDFFLKKINIFKVTAGIMTSNELREFDAIETEHIKYLIIKNKFNIKIKKRYWTPIQWAFLLLRRARDQGLVDSDIIYVVRNFKIKTQKFFVIC